jgi:transglutaminase/protease-like cytokinesis protein 3
MKIILFVILIFISSTFNKNVPKSSYSLLLGDIREDIIDSALLNLPKRESVDILKMSLSMADEKEKNSLTDAETAFLIYKWIAKNIVINCYYYMYKYEQSDLELYKSGKGQPLSISSLFNRMCSFLKIKSDSIPGYYKTYNSTNYYHHYNEIIHTYNYIIINNNTYLVDPTLGIGNCNNYYYEQSYSDFYFGTKPDFLIKSHFPKDDNFQLLNDVITKDEWSNLVFIDSKFYLIGMKSITPTSENISIRDGKINIVINFDSLQNTIGALYTRMIFSNGEIVYLSDTYKNGIYEVSTKMKYKPRNQNPMRIEIYNCDEQDCIHKNFLVLYHITDWNW